MQLTPDQQKELSRAKTQGIRQVALSFTPEQRKAWRETLEQELAGKDENLAYFHKWKAAAEEQGFLGDIRRAILLSRRPTHELAETIGVDPHLVSDFCIGDAELPASIIDRLVETLGLRLVQDIPR